MKPCWKACGDLHATAGCGGGVVGAVTGGMLHWFAWPGLGRVAGVRAGVGPHGPQAEGPAGRRGWEGASGLRCGQEVPADGELHHALRPAQDVHHLTVAQP